MARRHSTSSRGFPLPQSVSEQPFRIPSPDDLAKNAEGASSALLADLIGMDEQEFRVDLDAGGAGRGHLNNMAPTTLHPALPSRASVTNLRSAVAGIDWLEWCSYGKWVAGAFDDLRARLNEGKAQAQDAGSEAVIEFDGEPVSILKAGARRGVYCTWMLKFRGVEIGIVDCKRPHVEDEHGFRVHVVATSLPCMQMGVAVFSQVMRFLVHLGFRDSRNVPSRVDLASDLLGTTTKPFVDALVQGRVVRRARKGGVYFEGKWEDSTGLVLGGKCIMLRVYDKGIETSNGGDDQKAAVLVEKRWKCDVWEARELGATRVEFQLRRDILRLMGWNEVTTLLGNLTAVSEWCCEKWCRFTGGPVDRGHTERAASSNLWKVVLDSYRAAFGAGPQEPVELRKPLRVIPAKLLAQAAGCMSSALAVVGMIPDAVEDAVAAVQVQLTHFMQRIVDETVRKRGLLETRASIPILVGGNGGQTAPYAEFAEFSGETG